MTLKERAKFYDETAGMSSYEKLLYKLAKYNSKNCCGENLYVYKLKSEETKDFNRLIRDSLISICSVLPPSNVIYSVTHKGENFFDKTKRYNLFLSHASKDKIAYVEELKQTLDKLGLSIFYDKDSIEWGDKWKEKILDGVKKSEFAIIVVSKNYFGREWTEKELSEFLNRQNDSGQKIILPILYNITYTQLEEKYPHLADIQAISSQQYSNNEIAILFAKQFIKRLKGKINE